MGSLFYFRRILRYADLGLEPERAPSKCEGKAARKPPSANAGGLKGATRCCDWKPSPISITKETKCGRDWRGHEVRAQAPAVRESPAKPGGTKCRAAQKKFKKSRMGEIILKSDFLNRHC